MLILYEIYNLYLSESMQIFCIFRIKIFLIPGIWIFQMRALTFFVLKKIPWHLTG